jgi:hypothetical protein
MSYHYDFDWRAVPMPPAIARLERDARGYPIFYCVIPEKPETPVDFRVLNPHKRFKCGKLELCGLCGEPLGYRKAFLGGPMCVADRAFGDAAMHLDCAEYAVQVCPFLATDLQYVDHDRMAAAAKKKGSTLDIDPLTTLAKPKYVVLYEARGFDMLVLSARRGIVSFRPAPATKVTYFYRGQRLEGLPADLPEVIAKARAVVAEGRKAQHSQLAVYIGV